MRIKVGAGLLLTTLISSAGAHEGHHHHEHSSSGHAQPQPQPQPQPNHDHNDLRPHTHIAYHHVTSACATDVKLLCQEEERMEEQQDRLLPQTMGDPFLDWVLLPQAPAPPEIEDMARVMDHVVNSFFSAPSTQFTYIYLFEEPQQTPHFVMDSMAAKLATETEPEEIPELAHTLQKYGKQLMEKHDVDTFHHHMARRLTEMDATTIQHHVRLPFGCPKNRCLRQAMMEKKLSEECDLSIQQLETTYQLEEELEHRHEMFLDMMWLYISVLCVLMVLLTRKYRAHRADRMLRIRILQAVYSNPAIKSQIEAELGGSVGSVPPLPPHALRLMSSGGKDLKRRLRCMKLVHHLSFFVVLLAVVFFGPIGALLACIFISISRVIQLCLVSSVKDRECECCCCGASTSGAASGTLTEAQECCGCCKGTGVCAPSCAACCGSNGCCCCCGCCDGSCNCCSKTKKVADDCTCCCCGATVEQAKDGILTEAQMCCNCCKGTGTCDPSCASCCGPICCCCGVTEKAAKEGVLTQAQASCSCCSGTGCCSCCSCCAPQKKGRGQKHVFASKHAVYQGVPLQVV